MRSGDEPIRFVYAPKAMIALAFLGLAMAAASGTIALQLLPDLRLDRLTEAVGYFGMLFFGAATILVLWRLATVRGPIVVITGTGLTDHRLAPEEMPWSAIDRIGTFKIGLQKFMVLDLDPAAEARLQLTRTVRWSRRGNAALGISGLTTSAQGLNVDFDTLVDLCRTRRDVALQTCARRDVDA